MSFITTNLAKGVRKVACSLATIASHKVAEVTQAPIAGPLAPIMIGFGQSKNWSNTARLLLDNDHEIQKFPTWIEVAHRPGVDHIVQLLWMHGLYCCREVNSGTIVGISACEYHHLGIRVADNFLEPGYQHHHGTSFLACKTFGHHVYLSARVTIIGPVHPFNFLGSFMVRVVT